MKKLVVGLLASIVLFSCGGSKENQPEIYQKDNIALDGYDPVAYFTDNEAVKGSNEYRCEYKGAIFHFSSKENQDAFIENSAKYVPAYGGWCAYAVAEKSTKMAPDPTAFKIQDGKLLLFYDNFITNIQGGLLKKWDKDPEDHKERADDNWEKMVE